MEIPRAGRIDVFNRIAVHLHHPEHRFAVGRIAFEGAHCRSEFSAGPVGYPMQDGRQCTTQPSAGVAVVGQTIGHQQASEI